MVGLFFSVGGNNVHSLDEDGRDHENDIGML
jgi:hypothetical protein